MPRPQKSRKICHPPKMLGFKPFGISSCDGECVILYYEEFECFKLLKYENMSQVGAAKSMGVSQPTLTRIYNCALKKIALAFVDGKVISIEGGNFELEADWYKCKKCHKLIKGIENHIKCRGCKNFNEEELIKLNP